MKIEDIYLGDGAYASFDGFNLILYTHNGICRTNEVYLEPMCLQKLDEFRKEIENVRSQNSN